PAGALVPPLAMFGGFWRLQTVALRCPRSRQYFFSIDAPCVLASLGFRSPPTPPTLPVTPLVHRRVGRHPRHQRELAALALEHAPPEAVGVAGEDVAGERRLGEPGLLGELVVELPLAPSRVPGEDPDTGDVPAHLLDVVRHLD